jgi:hypothetical protein
VTAPAGALAEQRSLDDPRVVLAAWEEAAAVPRCAVGAVLVYHGGLVDSPGAALDLPVSAVSAQLARLWTAAFGPTAECLVDCAECAERLEVAVPVERLCTLDDVPTREAVDEHGLVVRCPSTRDLVAVATSTDPAEALLARCLSNSDEHPVDTSSLGPAERVAIEAASERLAGAAAALVTAACPACGTLVRLDVDPAELLWQRLCADVPAVLADVADLALAFGWDEADILAMSPRRRAAYLEIVRDRL